MLDPPCAELFHDMCSTRPNIIASNPSSAKSGASSLTAMGSNEPLHWTRRKGSADKRFRHGVYGDLLATYHEDRC